MNNPRSTAEGLFFISTIADATMCVLALLWIPYCFWRYGWWWGVVASALSIVMFTLFRHVLTFAFSFGVDPG